MEVSPVPADPSTDAFNNDCPGRQVFDHVTSRWGILVLAALREGPLRFYQLRDRIGGISEKMLSQNLRVLARDGLIERMVEPDIPPKVSYRLTPLGQEGSAPLRALLDWIALRAPDILDAQSRHDANLSPLS
ncbi:winged helix-turn-helix transcriptional regulator [Nonomuraea africana]|uniref:winged helix-turn-helix transcriptional regulator n=1 Tax=Nonomuraea africana TaxID=46171 RepID=UPI0033C5647D